MEHGILKRSLLSLQRKEKGLKATRTYRTFIVYKDYIIGLEATKARLGDSTIFNNTNGSTTTYNTGLKMWTRSGYSICHWKDNIFVLYGGISSEDGNLSSATHEHDVYFIPITEECARVQIDIKPCDLNDPTWWNSNHTAQIYQDNMYVLGGKTASDPNALNVWKFDLNTRIWSKCQVAGEAPKSRFNLTSALFRNKIYIFGGQTEQSSQNFNDLFTLNLQTMTWEKIHGDNFLPTAQFKDLQAEVLGRKIYLSSPDFDEFFIYDPITRALDKSQGVSPKEGFVIKSHENHSVLFHLKVNPDEGNYTLQFEHFHTTDDDMADEIEQEQPIETIDNADSQILSQADHMKLLWKEKPFADVTFIVQNEEIPAHRSILLKSLYFQNLFKDGSNKINIPDISSINFKAILEFLYIGSIALTEPLALDLIVLAKNYGVPLLKADCETYLSNNLKAANLLDVIKAAEAAASKELEDKIISFLAANSDKLQQEIDLHLVSQELFAKAVLKKAENK